MKIATLIAHEILASGGYPTLEVVVTLDSGEVGTASVPYGISAGSHEASVLIDGDQTRWHGQGMLKAAANVMEKIAPVVMGMDASDQRALDEAMIELDGTPNKAKLGGNAILAVSLASARAAAAALKKPLYQHIIDTYNTGVDLSELPHPMIVAIEGGKHADNTTDLQEYCFLGLEPKSPTESVRIILECYHELKKVLKSIGLSTNVGNEGAFAPSNIASNEAPFRYMTHAIEAAGYTPGKEVGFSIDAAANEFYKNGEYHMRVENKKFSSPQMVRYYEYWLENYPIVSVEDLLSEDDWDHWPILKKLTDKHKVMLIGDDLTVTNVERLQKAIDADAISAILIKLNQIGTLTETVDCCLLARKHNMATVTSHRGGGETNDTAMVDLAVAVGSAYIKVGPTRGERVAKYNRLIEIERELND
jgi:enolase